MKSWPAPRTAAIGAPPNTWSWPLMKQASISRILAPLTLLCRRRVPASQAPCGHCGHLPSGVGLNKVSPGRRWIATPLALAEVERNTNFVASRKDERAAGLPLLGHHYPVKFRRACWGNRYGIACPFGIPNCIGAAQYYRGFQPARARRVPTDREGAVRVASGGQSELRWFNERAVQICHLGLGECIIEHGDFVDDPIEEAVKVIGIRANERAAVPRFTGVGNGVVRRELAIFVIEIKRGFGGIDDNRHERPLVGGRAQSG